MTGSKNKDAYDIYYCVKNYPGGIDSLVEAFRTFPDKSIVKEGLMKIADKFASPEHFGPVAVADFNEITDMEERMIIKRDAFERVSFFLKKRRKSDNQCLSHGTVTMERIMQIFRLIKRKL